LSTTLKVSCAWIFALVGDQTFQNFAIILKLLSKCSNKFAEMNDFNLCNECVEAAITLWENSFDLRAGSGGLSTEFTDIISAISKCLLDKVRFAPPSVNQNTIAELKRIIPITTEIFSLMDCHLQITWLNEIYNLAMVIFISTSNKVDSIYLFNSIILMLGKSECQKDHCADPHSDQIPCASFFQFKVKAYLSLAFCFCELG
jgi:hypothetical protein